MELDWTEARRFRTELLVDVVVGGLVGERPDECFVLLFATRVLVLLLRRSLSKSRNSRSFIALNFEISSSNSLRF